MADALLVGSVNLESVDEVMAVVPAEMGDTVRRIPDGETGDRLLWVYSLEPSFAAVETLERSNETWGDAEGHVQTGFPVFRPRAGVKPEDVEFPDLGYATDALASYQAFREGLDSGAIADGVRFQVSLPTAYMALMAYVDLEFRDAMYPAYTRALGAEIARMLEVIPAAQLAIQWDIPCEVGITEGVDPRVPWKMDDAAEQLGEMSKLVPDGVELGFHHCYGDPPDSESGHGKHWLEPSDAGAMVRLTNAFVGQIDRRIDWVHMPVPIERSDEAFFAPLADLELPDGTELFMGLVHFEDGAKGTQKRIDAASKYIKGFGVATECGLGRIPRDEVVPTMAIHRQVTVPAA